MSEHTDRSPASEPAVSRRKLLAGGAAVGAGLFVAPSLASAMFHGTAQAMKVGLIGCGGRARGALWDAINAAKVTGMELEIVGVCDWFEDRAKETAREHSIDESLAFHGGDSYKKVCDAGCDLILTATPPLFRATHVRAIIESGAHAFIEKPVAVDPVGIRHMLETGKMADEKKLCVVAGTQRRHGKDYQAQKNALDDGKLGEIVGGEVNWNQGALWWKTRNEGESVADYLVRNWVSFLEMSGDHIVEQHVHNIDIAAWFLGRYPRAAVAFGDRVRRQTGNQYDFFSTDFDFGEGVHIHSMCRQINGCVNNVGEHFKTTTGQIWGGQRMVGENGPLEMPGEQPYGHYVAEHVDLQNAIMNGEHINEIENVTMSTASAMMGRISAYTGERVLMDDLLTNTSSKFYNLECQIPASAFEDGGSSISLPEEGSAPRPGTEA